MRYVINRSFPSLFDFDTIFNDFFASAGNEKFPLVDIYETEKSYVVEAEVAGYKEEDIKIFCSKKILSLSSDAVAYDRDQYITKEIYAPAFQRSFQLPEDADEENINASSSNGILRIEIMKKEKLEPKRITVKIN